MTEITMDMIKELRHKTGVGIGQCKEALSESKGDIEAAVAILRKKGMATAVKKEGRSAKEGVIAIVDQKSFIAFVEINAETDFVVNNDRFQNFVALITREIATLHPSSLEQFLAMHSKERAGHTIEELRAEMVAAIGENIQISRLSIISKKPDETIGVYSHLGGKIASAVVLKGTGHLDLASEIAMHVAATSPDYLSKADVPADVVAKERDIAATQVHNKPPQIAEKIIEGRLQKFYEEVCLESQKFVKDDSLTIHDLVAQRAPGSKLMHFVRWQVGQASA